MALYHLYFFDGDGRNVDRRAFDCADDHAALQMARSLCLDHDIDVWQKARRIAQVKPGDFAFGSVQ